MADKKIKSPIKKKNLISSLLQDTTIGGGVGVQDTEYETIPSAEFSLTKGKTTVGASVAKGFSKVDKHNINSQLGFSVTREGDASSVGVEGIKSGKNKYLGVTFSKKFNKGGQVTGDNYIKDLV